MQEVLDNTHDQEDHGEGQAGHGQNAQEGQTGVTIKHGNQIGNSIGDPVTDGIENSQNSIENSSSSLQKHTFQHKNKYLNRRAQRL